MPRSRYNEKQKTRFFPWLLVSLFTSTLISFSFNLLLKPYITNKIISVETVLDYFSFGLGFLLLVIFILMVALFNKQTRNANEEFELSNFRAFTDKLQSSSSVYEIYEALQKFISHMPQVSHSTMFYHNDKYPDGELWKRVSNAHLPLCSMTHRSCPVLRTRKECIVRSIDKDIKCACQNNEYTNGSYICLPIIDSGNVQSVLQVYSNKEFMFDNLTVQKVKSYLDVTKSMISSKKALTVLDKKASTDKLTKLYNRSFLDSYLENQIEASELTGHPLSIIMVDIDHFKKINDTYGHAAGDHVLIVFSEILVRCTRQTDLVARFGGEEFIAVLPSTNIETANSIAERIRQTTSSTNIPPLDGIYIPQITCSLGISSYPSCSGNRLDLIKTADSALYKAKESGRNCVKVYTQI